MISGGVRVKAIGFALVLALAPQVGAAGGIPGIADYTGRVTLGWGRLFDNDALGDGHDRWRTGSHTVSLIRAPSFAGDLPTRLGDLLEWRLSSQIVAPANLAHPAPGDRRYAGMLSIGLHAQSDWQGYEVEMGADLVAIGPSTGVAGLQKWVHNALDIDAPDTTNQMADRIVPTVSAEVGRKMTTGAVTLRPFAGAQVGIENLVRVGADVTIGAFGKGAVMVRDGATGQRYRAAAATLAPGFSLVAGGDVTRVFSSVLLEDGPEPEKTRTRLRAGLHWQGQRASVFYGATWLSPEFQGQGEGQVVGSLTFNLRF